MKRLLSLLFAAALLLLLVTPVLADELPSSNPSEEPVIVEADSDENLDPLAADPGEDPVEELVDDPEEDYADDSLSVSDSPDPVVDRADLLTFSEEAALRTNANDIELAHGCQVIIVTVDGLGGSSAQDYADRFFLNNGYGTGADRDGILLLVSMENRDYHISTHGFAIDAFTDNGLLYLEDGFLSDLSDGNYYDAFRAYQDRAEDMLSYYDGSATPEEREEMEKAYESFAHKTPFAGISIGAAVLGFLGSLLPMSRLKKEVKTVHKQSNAGNYVRDNSLILNVSRDIYLYANVTSHVIERSTSSGGGGGGLGGGGSTTHSTGGSTFGGHGGKF